MSTAEEYQNLEDSIVQPFVEEDLYQELEDFIINSTSVFIHTFYYPVEYDH